MNPFCRQLDGQCACKPAVGGDPDSRRCSSWLSSLALVSYSARWALSLILGPQHWSSISIIQRTQNYSAEYVVRQYCLHPHFHRPHHHGLIIIVLIFIVVIIVIVFFVVDLSFTVQPGARLVLMDSLVCLPIIFLGETIHSHSHNQHHDIKIWYQKPLLKFRGPSLSWKWSGAQNVTVTLVAASIPLDRCGQ